MVRTPALLDLGDLAVLTYAAQLAVDSGRGTFHNEHMGTISSTVAKARASEGVEDIIDLLCTSRVAWITKAENDELTKRATTPGATIRRLHTLRPAST
ncbi:hypothetical protein [Actinotalea sp. K2]|uniref:hypothetical protein n=1 Tax=Actinotalea sp. K2 TaxID=2939438 RepID=UPI0020178B9D|nr:hypothetical protein [Actinotalea sp. K2]MCL3863143.1 hypothetical protein [Actinotalea sp. K2]